MIKNRSWFNRNIAAMGFASLFADFGQEMVTALLPAFIFSLNGNAASLGLIEGIADASTGFMKLLSGWYSDRIKNRKIIASIGYGIAAIGVGCLSLTAKVYQILICRSLAWMGKGIREPARDALLVESTHADFYGRAFGFHRAMDTIGAILGPLLVYSIITYFSMHTIFAIAFIPCFLSFIIIAYYVHEPKQYFTVSNNLTLQSFYALPKEFLLFVASAGLFGLGYFSPSLLIFRSIQLLSPGNTFLFANKTAIMLYTLYNITYAACSFPAGMLADIIGKKRVLIVGYSITIGTYLLFMVISPSLVSLTLLFIMQGISIAIVDSIRRSVAADLLPEQVHASGYAALATVLGIGNFVSSSVVGILWSTISPYAGFLYAASMCVLGCILLTAVKTK